MRETGDEDAPAGADRSSAVVAELDAFLRVQGFDDDDSALTATTPAQKAFLADQESYYGEQGWEWAEPDATLALAFAVDACQTSILHGHRFDTDLLRRHVATSPLYAGMIPADSSGMDRTGWELGAIEMAAYGASYLCPADGRQWMSAYEEVSRS